MTVTAAAFSPTNAYEIRLSLSREFEAGETATVSYVRPQGAAGLWDEAGSQLADVVDLPVTMRDASPAALAAPPMPTLTQASATSLTVSWLAAETSGQTAVTGFGVRYRQEGANGVDAPCPRRHRHHGYHRRADARPALRGAGASERRGRRRPVVGVGVGPHWRGAL